jgi:hypothetical protein
VRGLVLKVAFFITLSAIFFIYERRTVMQKTGE